MKIVKWICIVGVLWALSGCKNQPSDEHSGQEAENPAASSTAEIGVCPVSGEELGSMGDPVTETHAGKEVQLCCKNCVKKFKADPEKYLAKLGDPHAKHEAHDHGAHDH